jgi:hypothetical protein
MLAHSMKLTCDSIPKNFSFRQRDFEMRWHATEPPEIWEGIAEKTWDIIHMRMLAGSVSNWKELFFKVFKYVPFCGAPFLLT